MSMSEADEAIANEITAGVAGFPGLSPDELAKAGAATAAELDQDAYARILLLGPAKTGKTTAVVSSAPRPLVINCDGISSTKFAATHMSAQFVELQAGSRASWKRACAQAVRWANEDKIGTIVVDTLTILADDIVAECRGTLDGFDLWNEVADSLQQGLRQLLKAPAHLFITCHMDPKEDNVSGLLPAISGSTSRWLPGRVHDWVLFECDPDMPEATQRAFLVGPQKTWTHSGRNVRRSCRVPANVPALFEELGIAL